jgi:hypothetical protein
MKQKFYFALAVIAVVVGAIGMVYGVYGIIVFNLSKV